MKVYKAKASMSGKPDQLYGLLGLDPNDPKDMDLTIEEYATKVGEAHGFDVPKVVATIVRGVKYALAASVNKGRGELVPSKTNLEQALKNGAIEAFLKDDMELGQTLAAAAKASREDQLKYWETNPSIVNGFLATARTNGEYKALKLEGSEPELEPLLREWSKSDE